MDPSEILNAAGAMSPLLLALIVMGGIVWAAVKVIGWGSEVTTLLGNHLRHDLGAQTESLSRIEHSLNEQTLVLRTLGRQLFDVAATMHTNATTTVTTAPQPISVHVTTSPTEVSHEL